MPKQINLPNFGQGLVSRFALKGRFQPVLDETIVPVVVVSSFEGAPASVAPNVANEKSAVGFADYVWVSGGARGYHLGLENPVGSGVGVSVSAVTLGWSFSGGDDWMAASLARNAFVWRGYVTDIIPVDPGTGTLVQGKGWRDDRLRSQADPIASVTAAYTNTNITSADRIAQFLVPELYEPILITTAPATLALNAQVRPQTTLDTILLAPGRALYTQQLGNVSVTLGSFAFASMEWTEIPLTAGNVEIG